MHILAKKDLILQHKTPPPIALQLESLRDRWGEPFPTLLKFCMKGGGEESRYPPGIPPKKHKKSVTPTEGIHI